MAIICLDYGHGGLDPGAVYKGRMEKTDNLQIGLLVAKSLRSYGVVVDETRSSDKTMSLSERCRFANKKKYDFFISFHRNAFKAEKADGVETFIYVNKNKRANSLATRIQNSLVGVGFKDRKLKTANFKVLRETLAPAILIEIGFIDNSIDNAIFIKKNEQIAQAIASSIMEELGIAYTEKNTDKFYRVIAGTYKVKANADKKVKDLKKLGIDSFIQV